MKAGLRTGIAITAAASFLAASSATASAACPGEDLRVEQQERVAMEQSIVCLVNERRSDAGLRPVYPNGQLASAAQRHSSDMVARGFFAHTAPGGITFVDRILNTGYTRRASSWLVGENLAWGTGRFSTPAELVQSWMDSPPHRENLLRARFREIGIAAVLGTPSEGDTSTGVTVSSEYGFRAGKRGSKKLARRAAKRARAARRSRG